MQSEQKTVQVYVQNVIRISDIPGSLNSTVDTDLVMRNKPGFNNYSCWIIHPHMHNVVRTKRNYCGCVIKSMQKYQHAISSVHEYQI